MYPKISIITVVYNGEKFLPTTIMSIRNQTYTNIEYIVIDGGSKDNTLQIIKQNENIIAKWISEKDNGLYDAMNKGIDFATGDFLIFMNAGDIFYDQDTLKNVFKHYQNEDVIYGDTLMLDDNFQPIGLRAYKKLPENLTWRSMRLGMVVCHQSLFVKREIAPKYDLSYPYSSDIDWTIRVLQKATRIKNAHLIISKFLAGGISSQKKKASLKDRFYILVKHFGIIITLLTHIEIIFRYLIRKIQSDYETTSNGRT